MLLLISADHHHHHPPPRPLPLVPWPGRPEFRPPFVVPVPVVVPPPGPAAKLGVPGEAKALVILVDSHGFSS